MISCFAVFLTNAEAQKKTRRKIAAPPTSKISKTKLKSPKKPVRMISAGVVNSRAIDLIKPEYPKAARAVNIYGQVKVQVLIDVDGSVFSANIISGNFLLQSSAVKAAFQSKFEPLILGGEPISVKGIINYNFIPYEWNWLELGYALNGNSDYYTIKMITETLPAGSDVEKQLLRQSLETSENQDQIIESITALLRARISVDDKSSWFFEVGLLLAKVTRQWNIDGHTLDKDSQSLANLKFLSQNPPAIKEMLPVAMKKIIFFVEQGEMPQMFRAMSLLEEKFPYVGK